MSKEPKNITQSQLKKHLSSMDADSLRTLLLSLFKSSSSVKLSLSQLFLGQDFWSDLEIYYSDKLYNVFNPNERSFFTVGSDVSKAVGIVKEYCNLVFTGNAVVDARYKAKMYLEYVSQGLNCLDTYGDGSEWLYSTIDDYFEKVCKYLKKGFETKDEEAIAFLMIKAMKSKT